MNVRGSYSICAVIGPYNTPVLVLTLLEYVAVYQWYIIHPPTATASAGAGTAYTEYLPLVQM